MIQVLVELVLTMIAVVLAALVLPGIRVKGIGTALVVAFMLGLAFPAIQPLLGMLTLPINTLTITILALVLNGIFILIVTTVVPGFTADSFGWAMIFVFLLSALKGLLFVLL